MDPRGNKQEDISFSACPQLLVTEQPPQPRADMWGIPRGTEGRREEEVGGVQWDPRSSSYRSAQTAGPQASEDREFLSSSRLLLSGAQQCTAHAVSSAQHRAEGQGAAVQSIHGAHTAASSV